MKFSFLKYAWVVLAGSFLLPIGCTDLEEQALTEIPESEFGQTDEQFIAALGAAYTGLYGALGNHNGLWSLNGVSSDELVIPTRGADWGDGGQWTRMHSHDWNSNEQSVGNAWNTCYGGIATCNRLIETLETLNPDLAPPFVNELRGLRALWYYWLIDTYGNVPIVTKFSGGEPNPSNATRAEVYDFIVTELLEIIPTLDQNVSSATYARINANTARMLLAKMYLNAEVYTGTPQWQNAADALMPLMDGTYVLASDYFANFNANNTDLAISGALKENIFAIPYDQVFAPNFNLGQMTLHYGSQQSFNSQDQPWNGYATLQEFYDSYDDDDLRKGEYGNPGVRGNFLAGPQFAVDGSPILDASADDPGGPELVFEPELNELAPGAYRQAGARIGKFEYENGFTANLNNDFPVFRYADALLMRAEALWHLNNGSQEALDLVNLVRRRAYGDMDHDYASLTPENLLAERGREMFVEMFRRSDLIRFGKWGDPWWEKPASDGFRELMPLPDAQLAANPNLVQNPGY